MTQDEITKELQRIQNMVPKMIRDKIVVEAEMTPTIKKIALEALESGDTSQELKDKLKILLDSGELSKIKYTENKKYRDIADRMITRLIKKSVKEGRLPKKININNEKSNS